MYLKFIYLLSNNFHLVDIRITVLIMYIIRTSPLFHFFFNFRQHNDLGLEQDWQDWKGLGVV